MDRRSTFTYREHTDPTPSRFSGKDVIGRRDLLKLTAGAGVAAFGMTGSGLFLPWIDIGRAAEARRAGRARGPRQQRRLARHDA